MFIEKHSRTHPCPPNPQFGIKIIVARTPDVENQIPPKMLRRFGSWMSPKDGKKPKSNIVGESPQKADLKMIAKASPEDCVKNLCNGPHAAAKTGAQGASAPKPDRQRSLDQLAYAPDVPENLRTALKQVLFAQVKVPFTDGYRRKLRHEGHNLNAVHGPLKLFVTANFADVYSPVLLSMLLADSDENPVAEPVEVSWANLAAQCPEMCTLQEMHRRVAASPRTQAKFWLLFDDLVDRYLLAIGHYYVGSHRNAQVINYMTVEDDACSSGELGLAGFATDEEEPCEAQARGFTHGHRKVYGIPEPMGPEMLREFQAISAAKPEEAAGIGDDANAPSALTEFLAQACNALVRCASTLQYEAATLPARQMQQRVPAEKFTPRQQELSRLDGGLEIDGTQRQKLEPTPEEPLGHIAAEEDQAALANRPVRNAYREVPLTGCHNSLLPAYRQPHFAFQAFPMIDDFGRHVRTTETSTVLQSLPTPLPWQVDENNEITDALSPQNTNLSPEEFRQDAERYALAFSRDARALHGHNHDHNCSFTCIKYVKQNAKKIAEKSLDTGMNIVCRFFFYVVLVCGE